MTMAIQSAIRQPSPISPFSGWIVDTPPPADVVVATWLDPGPRAVSPGPVIGRSGGPKAPR
jgi:hypothetical protein